MTHQEIISIASEAGLSITPPRAGQYNGGSVGCDVVGLTKFAALVAAKAREACAKLCDDKVFAIDHSGKQYRREATASQCADAIRARTAL